MKYLIVTSMIDAYAINNILYALTRPDLSDTTRYQYAIIKHPTDRRAAIAFSDEEDLLVAENGDVVSGALFLNGWETPQQVSVFTFKANASLGKTINPVELFNPCSIGRWVNELSSDWFQGVDQNGIH